MNDKFNAIIPLINHLCKINDGKYHAHQEGEIYQLLTDFINQKIYVWNHMRTDIWNECFDVTSGKLNEEEYKDKKEKAMLEIAQQLKEIIKENT